MADEPSGVHAVSDDERAEIERDYPAWQTWPGVVPPIVYARRPRTSPPMVVRTAIGAAHLRAEIERAEREWGAWR